MDRLMEANNVANHMRRRERPKSIMPNGLDSRAAVERRAYDQGPPMPVRSSAITDMRVPQASGEAVRLGQSRQGHIALLRFRVLGTGDARHEMQIQKGRFTGVFLLPRMRPGGVRSSDRGAAPARQIPMHPQEGELLRVSRNAGFVLWRVQVRETQPRLVTNPIRHFVRERNRDPLNRAATVRVAREQWGVLGGRVHVPEPGFSFHKPWSGLQPGPRDVPGWKSEAGVAPSAHEAARVAQVRIELQEGMRYAISSEEDR
jgi:hypothetical protein